MAIEDFKTPPLNVDNAIGRCLGVGAAFALERFGADRRKPVIYSKRAIGLDRNNSVANEGLQRVQRTARAGGGGLFGR